MRILISVRFFEKGLGYMMGNLKSETVMALIFAAILVVFLLVLIIVTVKVFRSGDDDEPVEDDEEKDGDEEVKKEKKKAKKEKKKKKEADQEAAETGQDQTPEPDAETEKEEDETGRLVREAMESVERAKAESTASQKNASEKTADDTIDETVDDTAAGNTDKLDSTLIEEALAETNQDTEISSRAAKERAESPGYNAAFDSAFVTSPADAVQEAAVPAPAAEDKAAGNPAPEKTEETAESEVTAAEKPEDAAEEPVDTAEEAQDTAEPADESTTDTAAGEPEDTDTAVPADGEPEDTDPAVPEAETEEESASIRRILQAAEQDDGTGGNPVNQVNITTANSDKVVNTKNPEAGIEDMHELETYMSENPVPKKKKRKISKREKVFADKFDSDADKGPAGDYFWYNNQDIEELSRKEDMYFHCHYFNRAEEAVPGLITEMYDCGFVRTEEILQIAYGISFRIMSRKKILQSDGNAGFDLEDAVKQPSQEDREEISRKWKEYVDSFRRIIVFNAPEDVENAVITRLYDYGKQDPALLLESPE